jgi:hypothetical protein
MTVNENLKQELPDEIFSWLDFKNMFQIHYTKKYEATPKSITVSIKAHQTVTSNSETEITLFLSRPIDGKEIDQLIIGPNPQQPPLFNCFLESSAQNSYYLSNNPKTTQVIPKVLTPLELETLAEKEEAKSVGKTIGTYLAAVLVIPIMIGIFLGSRNSLAYLIRLFQIIEILANFSKINVVFGRRLDLALTYVSNVKFPEVPFIEHLSPFGLDDEMRHYYSSGTRGKLSETDLDQFVFYGQNFLFSVIFVTAWVTANILILMGYRKNFFTKFSLFLYRLFFGIFYFDFQLICSTEMGIQAVKRKKPAKVWVSYSFSVLILMIMLIDLLEAFNLLRKRRDKKVRAEMEKLKDYKTDLMLGAYNEGMSEEAKEKEPYYLIEEKIRFMLIQSAIAGLQLLHKSQASVIVCINLIYFGRFSMMLWERYPIFSSKIVKWKAILQELCIMLVLIAIWIFSRTSNPKFGESEFYKNLEMTAIVSIGLALLAEFLNSICNVLIYLCKKFKSKKKVGEKSMKKAQMLGVTIQRKTGSKSSTNKKINAKIVESGGKSKKAEVKQSPLRINPGTPRRIPVKRAAQKKVSQMRNKFLEAQKLASKNPKKSKFSKKNVVNLF